MRGADAVIDARRKGAAEQLRTLAPDGIDTALVLAAGDSLTSFLQSVRNGERVAYPNGVEPEPPKLKQYRLITYDGVAGRREFQRLFHAAAESHLTVPIAAVYPLAQAAKAHGRLERGYVLGRIVLRT